MVLLVGALGIQPLRAEEPITDEVRATAEEEPLELDSIEVTGAGFQFQQEVTLRLLRTALDKPKSRKQDAKDDWVCWVDEGTGSSFSYLNCARNGDLWALERPFGILGPTVPSGGYGKIMRSTRPVNQYKLQRAMDSLDGSAEFDEEFLAMAMAGQRPPRDIPDEEELDQFASAYRIIGQMQGRGASEARQISAIEAQGLTLERFNRIAELTEVYQSIENEVAARLDR